MPMPVNIVPGSALPSLSIMGLPLASDVCNDTHGYLHRACTLHLPGLPYFVSVSLVSAPSNPEFLKFHTFRSINIRTVGYRNSLDECCTNGTSLALLARLLHSQAGHKWNHRYWIHQSQTLFRECYQQYRLTAFAHYTLILHFHHTHPTPLQHFAYPAA